MFYQKVIIRMNAKSPIVFALWHCVTMEPGTDLRRFGVWTNFPGSRISWLKFSTFVSYLHLCQCESRPRSLVNPPYHSLLDMKATRSFTIPLWGAGCTWELDSSTCLCEYLLYFTVQMNYWRRVNVRFWPSYSYSYPPAWRGIWADWCGYQLCLMTMRCFSQPPFCPFQVRPFLFLSNICAKIYQILNYILMQVIPGQLYPLAMHRNLESCRPWMDSVGRNPRIYACLFQVQWSDLRRWSFLSTVEL